MAKHFNHNPTNDDFYHFREVNQSHWEAFQENKLTKEEVLTQRFVNYFKDYQIEVDGKQADHIFRDELAKAKPSFFDDTLETIDYLRENHNIYIVTNGVTETQQRRIAQTTFNETLNGIYISEQTGFQKPMPEFFDYIFKEIGEQQRKRNNSRRFINIRYFRRL